MVVVKYEKAQKEAVGKTAYYCALSAMQKSVRRGDAVRAVNWAKVAWRMEPYRLFCRLWTVLFEDCGLDVPSLLAFYKYRGGFSEFEKLVPLVVQLVNAKKSHDVFRVSLWLKGDSLDKKVLRERVAGHPFEKVLSLLENWKTRGLSQYSVWDYGVGDLNFDWTIELAQRSAKFDHEQLGMSMPLFFTTDLIDTAKCDAYDECEPCQLHDGFIPLEALDCHTRPGQHAMRLYLKYRAAYLVSEGLLGDYDAVSTYLFWCEGSQCRNYCPYSKFPVERVADEAYWLNEVKMRGSELLDGYRAKVISHILPEMQKVRIWLMQNEYQRDAALMKDAYLADWVEV